MADEVRRRSRGLGMGIPRSSTKRASLPGPIPEMVRRIVARFDPEQIILFGSYARGEAGPDSDADLLIVVDREGPKRPLTVEMYEELGDVGLAKDLIVVSTQDIERYRDEPGYILYYALREGITLYDRNRRYAQPAKVDRVR